MRKSLIDWLVDNEKRLFFALFLLSALCVGGVLWQSELAVFLSDGGTAQDLSAYFLLFVTTVFAAALIALFIMVTVFCIVIFFWFLLATASIYGIIAILVLAFKEYVPVNIAAVSLLFLLPVFVFLTIKSFTTMTDAFW